MDSLGTVGFARGIYTNSLIYTLNPLLELASNLNPSFAEIRGSSSICLFGVGKHFLVGGFDPSETY